MIKLNHADGILLDRIESSGVKVHSECRRGVCGACVSDLIEGEVEYVRKPLAFYREGQVVLCCAKTKTGVSIDI